VSTRRRFLRHVLLGGAAALAPSVGCAEKKKKSGRKGYVVPRAPGYGSTAGPSGQARVVVVRSGDVIGKNHEINRARLWGMLELGLRRLTGKDPLAALGQWIRPVDTVGLKVNCLAGRQMSTHRELAEALIGLLAKGGLPRNQCIVFDRSDLDLRRGGYPIQVDGRDYRCMGNDRAGYEQDLRVMPSGASRFSRIATRSASVLVNLPVLKDHGIAGLSGALKNNFGLVHNPNKFHLNGCDPHVAEVNSWDFVRNKQRLVICDALRVQVEGGPAFQPAGAEDHGAILLATDPVALDIVAWDLLETLRARRKLPSLAKDRREPVHILTAARMGLGVGERTRIKVIEVKA